MNHKEESMKIEHKEEIKNALLKGGLVIAPRQSGKTSALIEILRENPDSVLLVCDSKQIKYNYKPTWKKLYPNEIFPEDRFFTPNMKFAMKMNENDKRKNLYIDEYYFCEYNGSFKAATATPPYPVTLVKFNKEEQEYVKKQIGETLSKECLRSDFLIED